MAVTNDDIDTLNKVYEKYTHNEDNISYGLLTPCDIIRSTMEYKWCCAKCMSFFLEYHYETMSWVFNKIKERNM